MLNTTKQLLILRNFSILKKWFFNSIDIEKANIDIETTNNINTIDRALILRFSELTFLLAGAPAQGGGQGPAGPPGPPGTFSSR